MTYTPITSERLYEQIITQIEAQILSGELKEGDRLASERELTELFHVSRTAVREAINVLREKGLVVVQPGRGTFIANSISQTASDSLSLLMRMEMDGAYAFDHLLELRKIVEPEMAALAAIRASEEDVAAMQESVETMDESLQDMEAYVAADIRFHQAVARATKNQLICSIFDPIIDLLYEQRKKNFPLEHSPSHAQYYHRRIIEAVQNQAPDMARESMLSHLTQVDEDARSGIPETD